MSKTTSSSLAGSLTIILVWALSSLGVIVPPEVSSALTTVIMGVTVYLHGGVEQEPEDLDELSTSTQGD